MQSRQERSWLAILPPLVLVVLIVHVAVIIGGQTWAEPDRVAERTPAQLAAIEAIADGRAPGWWDRAGFGAPLWAEPSHGATYPGWWPAALAPERAAWGLDALAVLHALWAALGAALLARRLGADDTGALAAGALLGASDVVTAHVVSGAIAAAAHLPWAALAADALARAPDRRERAGAAAAVAAALAAMIVAGRWLIAADGAVIAAVVVVGRAPGPRRLVTLGWVALAVALAGVLAAYALVPAVLHLGGAIAPAAQQASPWATLELVVPGAQALGGAAGPGTHLGALALVLAVAAVVEGDRARRVLAGAAAVFAVAAGGALAPWDRLVGAGGAAGQPGEHAAAAATLLAALAGVGLSRIDALRALAAPRGGALTIERRTALALAGAGAALVVAIAALAAARPALARALEHAPGVGGLDAAVARVDHVLAHGSAAVAVALAAVGWAVLGRARGWARPADVALVVALAHAAILARLDRPTVERAALAARPSMLVAAERAEAAEAGATPGAPGELAALRAAGLPPRLYRPEHVPAPELIDQVQTFARATPSRAGVAAARWPAPGRHVEVDALWSASATAGARMLDRYAIELALLPKSIATPAALRVVGERSTEVLVATGARRPRAFVAPRWRWFPDDAAARAAVFPPPGAEPLANGVVARLGDGPAPPDDAGAGLVPCAVDVERPERVVVTCDGPAGVVVLAEGWAPGWTATVDGAAATVERVDGVLRGVATPAGAHRVVFAYAPPGARAGRYVTTAGLAALLALLLVSRRRRVP